MDFKRDLRSLTTYSHGELNSDFKVENLANYPLFDESLILISCRLSCHHPSAWVSDPAAEPLVHLPMYAPSDLLVSL